MDDENHGEFSAPLLVSQGHDRNEDRRWRRMAESVARIALDMSRVRVRDTVLTDIVAQARELLRVDLCYISLNDDRTQTTYVHSTVGVITEAYRTIRMPLGTGILGSAAGSDRSAQTSDYLRDPNILRIPEIDEIVHGEGVRAILGAPMRIDGTVVGALMVADRHRREYDLVEIATLEVLASLAAVTLETSQLISNLRETVTDLRAVQEQNRQHIDELEQLADADARLLSGLAGQSGIAGLEETLSHHLGCRVVVRADRAATRWGALDRFGDALNRLREEASQTRAVAIDPEKQLTVSVVRVGGREIGVIAADAALNTVQLQILQRGAMSLSARVLFDESVDQAAGRELSDLLRAVLAGGPAQEEVERIARLSALDLQSAEECTMLVIQCEDRHAVAAIVGRSIRHFGVAVAHEDHVCGLTTAADAVRLLDMGLDAVRAAGHRFTAGLAVHAVSELKAAHEEARRIARSMARLGRFSEVGTASKLGSLGLLLSESPAAANALIRDNLGPLLDYDERHTSDLARTVLTYFDTDRSVSRTAAALVVHENTIRQRLAKSRELLGEERLAGNRALDAHLALRTWALMADLDLGW